MTTDTQRALDLSLLSDQLAKLFGFADGVSDIVEHLFTIDSKDDLSDYLEQLLGSSARKQPTFHIFVENVIRYQQGQELIAEESKEDPRPVMPPQSTQAKLPDEKMKSKHSMKNTKAAVKVASTTKNSKQKATNVKEGPLSAKASIVPKETSQSSSQSSKPLPKESSQPAPKPAYRKFSSLPKPQQGDAQVKSCGCFGTRHDATVNCLYCGRISCSAEVKIVFCPSCRYQLHEKNDPVRTECIPSEALELKNKLLLRDKERNSQTKVYTDYMDHKSTWNTGQEATAAQEQERQRDAELHRRQGIQLELGL